MELVRLVVFTCLVFFVECSKKSRLEQKVDALDYLFKGKMFLVNDQLETGKQEREKLKTKLNQTLEYLETMGNADGKTVSDTNTGGIRCDLDILTDKINKITETVELSDRETGELSESVSRIKRGFQQEKVARKSDTQAVIDQLLEMQKNLNEMVTNINTIISNQNHLFKKMDDIISEQGDLANRVNNLSETLETTLDIHRNEVLDSNKIMQTQLTEMMRTTQNLESNNNTVAKQIQNVYGYVMPSFYCKHWLGLDDCLESHFTENLQLMNFIKGIHQSAVWLIGGSTKYEGRVEIIYQGRQGTVCDDDWDFNDARVVCRMLGYSGGIALQGHSFEEGRGEILLDDVNCAGSERSLFDCKLIAIGDHNCDHSEDAGVRCDP